MPVSASLRSVTLVDPVEEKSPHRREGARLRVAMVQAGASMTLGLQRLVPTAVCLTLIPSVRALEALQPPPDVVVLPGALPESEFRWLGQLFSAHSAKRPTVLVVSASEESAKLQQRVKLAGNAHLIAGSWRLVARVVTRVAELAGIAPRIHLPASENVAQLSIPGTLRTWPVRIENISQGGAKLLAPFEPEMGARYLLRAQLGTEEPMEQAVQVARSYKNLRDEFWHWGVTFLTEVKPKVIKGLAEVFPQERSHPRLVLEKQVRVKVQLGVDSGPRHYLTVVDLSEGGFLSRGSVALQPTPGQAFDVRIFWRKSSCRCRCILVRHLPAAKDGPALDEYAFRFTAVPRVARLELRRLRAEVEACGLRSGARQALRATSSAAPPPQPLPA